MPIIHSGDHEGQILKRLNEWAECTIRSCFNFLERTWPRVSTTVERGGGLVSKRGDKAEQHRLYTAYAEKRLSGAEMRLYARSRKATWQTSTPLRGRH